MGITCQKKASANPYTGMFAPQMWKSVFETHFGQKKNSDSGRIKL